MWFSTTNPTTPTLWLVFSSILATHQALASSWKVAKKYDFIIVGGGTAGLVLADRLTETGNQTVLVLEAGGLPTEVAAYETPGGNLLLGGSSIDWSYTTVPQPGCNDRILGYHRGRCLGGSSAINGLYYGRGSASIYDKWAAFGNPGWGWSDVYPLFVKSTTFVGNPANSNNNEYETWEPSAYSDGPLQVGFQGYVPPSGVGFIEACGAVDVPIVKDLNTGNGTGVKQGTGTIDAKFRRSSSYDSYYMKAKRRPNLTVLYRSPVQGLILSESPVAATGVVFVEELTGRFHNVTANKEVIMAAGAFNSPQILMISGIGPKSVLEKVGIAPAYVNENIGQNMLDHTSFSVYAQAQAYASTTDMSSNIANLEEAQVQYYSNDTGRYTAPSGITNGFKQISNETLISIGAEELITKGVINQAHIEFLYESVAYPGGPQPNFIPDRSKSYISITASNLAALSRGNVTLASSSISDMPVINPNYYAETVDQIVAVQAFKWLRQILADPALVQYTIGPNNGEVAPGVAIQSDADILEWARNNTIPNWHASGTNRMMPLADGGVVDARLNVYGVANLRVIDCSIIPFLPDANIQAAVYMIAEKGAQLIKEDYGF